MRILKKSAALLCLCAIAYCSCACSNADDVSRSSETGTVFSVGTPTEETEPASVMPDTSVTEITAAETEPEKKTVINYIWDKHEISAERNVINFNWIKFNWGNVEIEDGEPINPYALGGYGRGSNGEIEDDEDIILAKNFFMNFTESWVIGDANFINIDSYINNKYLKEYVRDNLALIIQCRYQEGYFYSHPDEYDTNNAVYFVYEINGIRYVCITADSNKTGRNRPTLWSHGATVGIRDGKIVNIVDAFGINNFHYLIYGGPSKAVDYIYNPNPWDDEKIAQRVVNAFKKYADENADGVYKLSFADAWASEGE